ncbi:hypothetical protein F1188_10100 [Roseospira marina]|uniref:Uncharacterized protein n=1 Tax=Roseospira marina TaxID=140057 RepID=A0A5M6IBG5_9PROT|nr:hypothetical protein [Roseospira marina]KAA5605583.1 hypothetical protein F1188_10100 [Roseospira marina]MBB4313353.1 hypothetical protein [Roseospira marina]MBB5085906.1 hypothetical protein [Roseospira marina]
MSRDRRTRHVPRPLAERRTEPFESAEAAWFWFQRARLTRAEGARLPADPLAAARPCDPDDIGRAVRALALAGVLRSDHLRVLNRHGRRLMPPDGRVPEEAGDAALWAEALDRLATPLRRKGIVRRGYGA